MDILLYSFYKQDVLETMYKYIVGNKNIMPLRQYINYVCFGDLERLNEIDELYAANYVMWFKICELHEFYTDAALHTKEINRIISYLEAGKDSLSDFEKEEIEIDIKELNKIKNAENKESEKLDFIHEMQKMDSKLRTGGMPSQQRYGKSGYDVNRQTAKEIMRGISSNYAEKFLCLTTYFKICMYGEIQLDPHITEHLLDFLRTVSDEEIIKSFKTHDNNNVKNYIGFLKRCKDFRYKMTKDSF